MTKSKSFGNQFSADLYRLLHLKSVYIAPVIMLLFIILNYSFLWIEKANMGGSDISAEIMAGLMQSRTSLFGASGYIDLSLFMAIICSIFVAGDFRNGNAKLSIARGKSKVEYFFSKWLSIELLAITYLLLTFLICGILSGATGYEVEFTGHEFGILMRSFALQLLVGIASTSVYVCLAFLFRSKGSTIGVAIGLYLGITLLATLLSAMSMIYEEEWLADIATFAPILQINTACSYADTIPTKELLEVIFVPLGYIIASCGIAVATFIRRDIK